jgi:hypothetical protein
MAATRGTIMDNDQLKQITGKLADRRTANVQEYKDLLSQASLTEPEQQRLVELADLLKKSTSQINDDANTLSSRRELKERIAAALAPEKLKLAKELKIKRAEFVEETRLLFAERNRQFAEIENELAAVENPIESAGFYWKRQLEAQEARVAAIG